MSDNVLSFSKKKENTEEPVKQKEEVSFDEIMKANEEKANRRRAEMAKANRNVIKSYKLKK